MIVDGAAGTAGIVVDEVAEVTVTADQLDAVHGGGSDAIDQIAKLEDRLVVVLDSERLFGDLELAV